MRRPPLLLIASILGLAAAASAQPSTLAPAYGTTNETYVAYGPPDFNPISGAGDFTRFLYLQPISGPTEFVAIAHLPTGAVLSSLAFEYCDSSSSGNHVHFYLGDCDATAGPCAALSAYGGADSTSNGCHFVGGTVGTYVVNNSGHRLFLHVIFDAIDPNLQFRGAVLGYRLQVSTAPATATFNDVPTNHPFFQFVEALAASGITGGCGGGNYCPDNPVTRGQMAVFLSKALGLSWPY